MRLTHYQPVRSASTALQCASARAIACRDNPHACCTSVTPPSPRLNASLSAGKSDSSPSDSGHNTSIHQMTRLFINKSLASNVIRCPARDSGLDQPWRAVSWTSNNCELVIVANAGDEGGLNPGRFQVKVRREADRWVAYRPGLGKRARNNCTSSGRLVSRRRGDRRGWLGTGTAQVAAVGSRQYSRGRGAHVD